MFAELGNKEIIKHCEEGKKTKKKVTAEKRLQEDCEQYEYVGGGCIKPKTKEHEKEAEECAKVITNKGFEEMKKCALTGKKGLVDRRCPKEIILKHIEEMKKHSLKETDESEFKEGTKEIINKRFEQLKKCSVQETNQKRVEDCTKGNIVTRYEAFKKRMVERMFKKVSPKEQTKKNDEDLKERSEGNQKQKEANELSEKDKQENVMKECSTEIIKEEYDLLENRTTDETSVDTNKIEESREICEKDEEIDQRTIDKICIKDEVKKRHNVFAKRVRKDNEEVGKFTKGGMKEIETRDVMYGETKEDDLDEVEEEVCIRNQTMEEGLGDPLSIAKDAILIKDAQQEIGKLDVLVCGTCHEVFHFVDEFNTHKEAKCLDSNIVKTCENDDKAQAWAFCLWKNSEMRSKTNADKNLSMWSIYQKWCQLPKEARDSWIAGGQTLLSLNKIRLAKMQEVKFKVKREEEKDSLPLIDIDSQGMDSKGVKNLPEPEKIRTITSTGDKKELHKDKEELNEYVVESILGKRFNSKKKHWEYKVKWENWDESQCSWEPIEHLSGCKALISRFEEKLKQEKEKKKVLESPKVKLKPDNKTDEDSDYKSGRRPQRSSKQKALNQVKRWLGDGSDNEDSNKRSHEDDDSDQSFEKRMKLEEESDDSFDEDDDDKVKKITSIKSRNTSNGLGGKKIPHNVLIPDAQGIVRINQKQLPSLSSGVYIMSKTAGIIKLDSQTSKIAASGGQAVVKVAPRIGQTHIRIVKKDGATTNRYIQMSPKSKSAGTSSTSRMTPKVTKLVRRPINTPKAATSFNQEDSSFKKDDFESDRKDDSDDGIPELEFPEEIIPPEPEDPHAEFTLDPTTGKIAGVEYPDPEPEPEITHDENKENPENTLDNIVKLAAADITEADLKPDITEPMDTSMSQNNSMEMEEPPPESIIMSSEVKKIEMIPKEEMVRMRKEPMQVSRSQQKFVITPNVKNPSNILERTLQTPRAVVRSPQGYARQVYAAKSPQRILNSSMTPKLTSPMNPMVRTVVRSTYSSKPKQAFPKQKIYMSSPGSKFNEGIIKHSHYPKPGANKRIGNIGSTTIYKRTPQQNRIAASPKVVPRTNVVRKPVPIVRSVVQKSPKPVISMPSLMDDDLPSQPMSEAIQATSILASSEASIGATAAGSAGTEADLSSFTLNDGEAPIFITGDDGTVYQVAGQNEQGQTILITQGPDGQQQCLLVTSENAAPEEPVQEEAAAQQVEAVAASEEMAAQQTETTEEPSGVVEGETQDVQQPLTIKTEPDTSDQVVAQVVRAEPPSPGGTHKVVVMLPDGNLMVTQVTPEEYASLELDK